MKRFLLPIAGVGLLAAAPAVSAQRFVAYVPTSEANVTGALLVSGDNSILGDASLIAAMERPAHVILSRGGTLLVCQTSAVHLAVGQAVPLSSGGKNQVLYDPILIALNKGSVEVRMPMIATDSVITSDMRFTNAAHHNKPDLLDLALRVSPNGDTCVENRGKKAPPLTITDSFGHASYLLKPDQHVVFGHGLLQEASPGDTTSCGCPPAPPAGMSLADAALRSGAGNTATFEANAAAFPFPTDVSKGTQEPTPLPAETPDPTRVKVSGTLVYEGAILSPAEELDAAIAPRLDLPAPALNPLPATGRRKLAMLPPPPKPTVVAAAKPPPPPPVPPVAAKPKKSTFGFFKKIFGG